MHFVRESSVYSLHIELRRLGIPIADQAGLQLSQGKAKELTSYMTEFTRPLLSQIYGGGESEIEVRWSHFVGQFGGLFKVYSAV